MGWGGEARGGERWGGEERGEREVNGQEGKEIRSMVDKPVLCVLIIILILLQWCQY